MNGMNSVVLSYVADMGASFVPFLALSVILIIVDCRFGLAAARVRGEVIRTSRMIRRSINKFVDYICWIALAVIFGQTYGDILGIPISGAIALLVVYGVDISSCYSNYFASRGINKRVNFFKLIKSDVGNAIEDIPEVKIVTEEKRDGNK